MGTELEHIKESIIKRIPLKKFGESEDINDLIYFLLEKNKYIQGSNIDINGGFL